MYMGVVWYHIYFGTMTVKNCSRRDISRIFYYLVHKQHITYHRYDRYDIKEGKRYV